MKTAGASEILELIYIQASHLKAHIFSSIITSSLHPYCVQQKWTYYLL